MLASYRPERQKSRFDRANFVIQIMVVLAVEVLGGLAVRLMRLNYPAVDGLELSLFGAEANVINDSPIPKPLMSTKVPAPSRRDESVYCRSSLMVFSF